MTFSSRAGLDQLRRESLKGRARRLSRGRAGDDDLHALLAEIPLPDPHTLQQVAPRVALAESARGGIAMARLPQAEKDEERLPLVAEFVSPKGDRGGLALDDDRSV